MNQSDLIEILSERPFVPIRLHLSNGREHIINHPELAIVGEHIVAIGLPREDKPELAGRITHFALNHVVEAEPLVSSNGS